MGKKCTCGIFKLTFDYSLIYLENNHSCILSAAQFTMVHGPLSGGMVGGGGLTGVMRPILGYNALLPHSAHRAACQVITFHLWSVVSGHLAPVGGRHSAWHHHGLRPAGHAARPGARPARHPPLPRPQPELESGGGRAANTTVRESFKASLCV